MSRTYNTRPTWVQNNDPRNVPARVSHDHRVTLKEQVGEEEYEPYWAPGTLRIKPLYRYWNEQIPCTLDVPEKTPSSWRFRWPRVETNETRLADKHCYAYPRWMPDNWRSKKDMKRLTNGSVRSKVKQQLHNAVRDNGSWIEFPVWYSEDPENPWPDYIGWEDVDINVDNKYVWSCWWD